MAAASMMPRLGLRLATAASYPTPTFATMLSRSCTKQRATLPDIKFGSSPTLGLGTAISLRSLTTLRRPFASVTSPKVASSILDTFVFNKRFQSTATIAPADASSIVASTSTPSSSKSQTCSSSSTLVSKPVVALHLYALAFLVYAIVVVGGLTRLTESGLSITEWNPGFKGMRLPTTTAEWEAEWDKYKQTPEFVLLNSKMSLDDFKSIYMWEWGHRVLGRVIGVAFVLPAAFFVTRNWVGTATRFKLLAIAGGIGFQGFLGWFMVKSGLTAPEKSGKQKFVQVPVPVIKDDHPNSTANIQGGKMRFDPKVETTTVPSSSPQSLVAAADWTPRVSHFRLAMHMGTAFLVYLAMLHTGLSVQRDYKAATLSGSISGVKPRTQAMLSQLANTLNHPLLRSHSRLTKLVAGLVFTTAMSGALVAGLDAGLVYNEFPTMGEGRIAPPMSELMDDRFSQREDGSDKVWRNLAQNPVTVQLIHRTLAITTACTVLALAWKTHRLSNAYANAARAFKSSNSTGSPTSSAATSVVASVGGVGAQNKLLLPSLPPRVLKLANASVVVIAAQVTLGITTLIYMVPIPLASAHQAGSLALLSVLIGLISSLRPIPKKILSHHLHKNTHILKKVLDKNLVPSARATQVKI
ncbi:related to COX15 - cytochrome oxidase assembly factor [Melanopsichium pennsylvanicum]|uniref:Related to COX15 - cytochrome oxidase assembly factor n=1 Tax=Melanopsichium pennsylvanicum TaxID=63383 RepID=A0AAJ4XRS3_9BASI|nr:related to COX15 - cytochrome oxidase assembly factor [Melanopsichium pennsylvanicum]